MGFKQKKKKKKKQTKKQQQQKAYTNVSPIRTLNYHQSAGESLQWAYIRRRNYVLFKSN